jgi:hypothetical protein
MPEVGFGSSEKIEKHVDQMETLATAFVIPAVVVLLAAATIPKEFEIFGLHLATADGYGLVVACFDVIVLLFCTCCWKACDLLETCDDAPKAITAILTHKWVLNPFACTSSGVLGALFCGVGPGLLTFSWWIALCALSLLSTVSKTIGPLEHCLFALYWAFGLLATVAVVRFGLRINSILSKLRQDPSAPVVIPSLAASNLAKALFCLAATAIGVYLFYAFRHVGI